jgi:hypothetical protein
MSGVVYHFTDTERLPWIVAANELQPGVRGARYAKHPCAFVWATTDPGGDPTAKVFRDWRYVEWGEIALVRLTLRAEDFVRWSAVPRRFPQWTPEHVRRLERSVPDPDRGVHRHWRVRAEPLPWPRVIRVETWSLACDWQPIDVTRACVSKVLTKKGLVRGVVLGDVVFTSRQGAMALGYYDIERVSAQDWEALT